VDYFKHWLKIGNSVAYPPKIFYVNWFRKDKKGKFLWPGFGENMRVLKWILEAVRKGASGHESPIGIHPLWQDMDWTGLETMDSQAFEQLMKLERDEWKRELAEHQILFDKFALNVPRELQLLRDLIHLNFDTYLHSQNSV
jgi:phosphoenolpyruvate carboxykinase (GTP)